VGLSSLSLYFPFANALARDGLIVLSTALAFAGLLSPSLALGCQTERESCKAKKTRSLSLTLSLFIYFFLSFLFSLCI